MPVHDWTKVDEGLFHAFHHGWISDLARALNQQVLPRDNFVIPEQNVSSPDSYVNKANRLSVHRANRQVAAVVEIISPGNKASRRELQNVVGKSVGLLSQGIHVLIVDLFPLGKHDRQGIHRAIWNEFEDHKLELPTDKPLTLASYEAGPQSSAYVEFVGIGDTLPDMPLFLEPEKYVQVPLERTYQATWSNFPAALKGLLENQ